MENLRSADYYGLKSGHTDGRWHQSYAEDHPEWFAMRQDGSRMLGKQGKHSSQRCYSNEEAFREHIETIEGLAEDEQLYPIVEAFIEHHGIQCGFCTPGQIMSTKALLARNPSPTAEDVKEALSGNMCICGCQPKIIKSVLAAAEKIKDA